MLVGTWAIKTIICIRLSSQSFWLQMTSTEGCQIKLTPSGTFSYMGGSTILQWVHKLWGEEFEWTVRVSNDNAGVLRRASVTDRVKGDSTRQRSEIVACCDSAFWQDDLFLSARQVIRMLKAVLLGSWDAGTCPLLPLGLCHFSHSIPLLRWWTEFGHLPSRSWTVMYVFQ